MLSRRLERKGYEVIVAVNGAEGVTKTKSERPDLVLMDMHLPVLDGWEATRQIKANPQTQRIPVIALTADAIAGEREKALAAGCDEYDTKPVDFPRLLEKIAALLEPVALDLPKMPSSNQATQRILLIQLRRDLEPMIYSILGYSDLLLGILHEPLNSALRSDLQKIHVSGMQLLQLVQAILNPVLAEIQQQEIDLCAPSLRRELLTPLSTIIGYCEMLLEEATDDVIPDLEQIQTAAQGLLIKVNNLDSLVIQHLQSIRTLDISAAGQISDRSSVEVSQRQNILPKNRFPEVETRRVLVVDSNESNCRLLVRQLQCYGCQVAIATTNDQALQALGTMPYDLIFLDVSELNLLELLQRREKWQHIPVLLTAMLDEMEQVIEGVAMGAVDYVTHPFQSVLLQNKVTACLERKQLQDQNGKFDSLFENAPVGIYQANEGFFQYVNPALVKLLGYPDATTLIEAVTNISSQIYVDFNRYAEFRALLEKHDRVTGFEYQARRHDGALIWVSEHTWSVRDSSKQLLYYEGIVEEITQRKLVEADLKQKLIEQYDQEHSKYAQQAEEIIQTDYFQQLQPNAEAQELQTFDRSTLPLKVLLVEDNELNSDMLSRRLQRYGYEVMIASDGADGVSKAASELPHIILMDISLPVIDGWEATQQIKANPLTGRIPIIALTAHAMTGDREKAIASGCDDYDTKPIDLSRLLSKIEACLKP
ncbi:circadian input kinase A [Leptolyngbya sp. NIES-2104]|nr:circadian input kinase A [Leptolyngbya sp. NIES-2104]